MKAFSADGLTIQQFNEPAGGQVVFHLHIHVIPRKIGVSLKPPASFKEEPAVLADQAQQRLRPRSRGTRQSIRRPPDGRQPSGR